jgi:hypothetical protein
MKSFQALGGLTVRLHTRIKERRNNNKINKNKDKTEVSTMA